MRFHGDHYKYKREEVEMILVEYIYGGFSGEARYDNGERTYN